jgi:hypothetical protein
LVVGHRRREWQDETAPLRGLAAIEAAGDTRRHASLEMGIHDAPPRRHAALK